MPDQPITGIAVTTANLVIRPEPSKNSGDLGIMPQWQLVDIAAGPSQNGYVRLANRQGWIAQAYLLYATSIRTMFVVDTDEVNLRAGPSTAFKIIGTLPRGLQVPVLIGTEAQFFVKLSDRAGWVSTRYLSRVPPTQPIPVPTPQPVPIPPPTPIPATRRIWGINIDPYNPTANPPAFKLAGLSFARMVFKVSAAPYPDKRTLDAAFAFYDGIIRTLANQGTRVILIINQESITDSMPWNGNGQTWEGYTPVYAAFLRRVAQHYGSDVFAYEIWNEQDISADTSMYIPPAKFGALLRASVVAVNGLAKVVSGGLASGDPIGYMKQCGSLAGVNGIGVHPYGQVVSPIPGLPNFGRMPAYLNAMHSVFPTIPLWVTEFGIARVDVNNRDLWPKIAQYMKECFTLLKSRSDIGAAVWFAWSDPQDNAGIVQADQTPKGPIFEQFKANIAFDVAT